MIHARALLTSIVRTVVCAASLMATACAHNERAGVPPQPAAQSAAASPFTIPQAGTVSAPDISTFSPFTPPDGGFTVQMPGIPSVFTQQNTTQYTYVIPNSTIVYTAADTLISTGAEALTANAKWAFDTVLNVMTSAPGSPFKVIRQSDIMLDNRYAGREVELDIGAPNALHMLLRMYLVGNHLYQVGVTGSETFIYSEGAKQFLSSLAVHPAQPKPVVFERAGDEHFSVLMPGAAVVKTDSEQRGTVTNYSVNANMRIYMVNEVYNKADKIRPAHEIFESIENERLHNPAMPVTVQSQKDITLQGKYHGHEWELVSKDQQFSAVMRVYIVGQRIYQLNAIGIPNTDFTLMTAKFFDSFKVTP